MNSVNSLKAMGGSFPHKSPGAAVALLLLAAGLSIGTAWSQKAGPPPETDRAEVISRPAKTGQAGTTDGVERISGGPGKRRFFLEPTLRLPASDVRTYLVTAEDSIPNDTLFQLLSSEGFPLAYYRKIHTDVCFDGKCRMLKVRLYWNITGRYLGIELPEGEFLSKSDHEPFTLAEYARMNALLADSLSPLADLTFGDLVPSIAVNINTPGVDAVTSATAPAMLDYVVEGAAYTTFRLWHFVYGPTQAEVVRLTEKALSPELLGRILESPDRSDISWALRRLPAYASSAPALLLAAADLLDDKDYSLSLRVLDALRAGGLTAPGLQRVLFEKYTAAGYSLKNGIIDLLKKARALDPQVAASLAQSLPEAKGALLDHLLDLFKEQEVADLTIFRTVSGLLDNENSFTARKAYEFLQQATVNDELVLERMKRYRSAIQ